MGHGDTSGSGFQNVLGWRMPCSMYSSLLVEQAGSAHCRNEQTTVAHPAAWPRGGCPSVGKNATNKKTCQWTICFLTNTQTSSRIIGWDVVLKNILKVGGIQTIEHNDGPALIYICIKSWNKRFLGVKVLNNIRIYDSNEMNI